MPKPNRNEKQSDYIKRCIPIVINEGTTKDSSQAAAICHSLWKKHRSKSRGEILAMELQENFSQNLLEKKGETDSKNKKKDDVNKVSKVHDIGKEPIISKKEKE